jgi:hypothetical protein
MPVTRSAMGFGKGPRSSTSQSAGYYFTEFDGTENPLSEGGVWTRGGAEGGLWTNPRTAGGLCYGTQTGTFSADDSVAHLSGFSANHKVRIVLRKTGSAFSLQEVEANLRMTITSGSFKCYEVNVEQSGQYIQCWQWLGGFQEGQPTPYVVQIDAVTVTGTTVADGSILEAQISGNIVTAWVNGVQQFSANVQSFATANGHEYLTTGQPGIGFYSHDRPNTDDFCAKSFEAWNL